ncbi:MAG: acyl carrier protein [Gelidibacter sp.]|nr:acyl carrier protein [Gelidibacter sp.]
MENFLEQMAELFEVDSVNLQDEVIAFDAWDSLTGLSIIALADDEYGITITVNDILEAKTIQGLYALFNQKK